MTDTPDAAVLESLDPAHPPQQGEAAPHQPRTLGFWRTLLWGVLIIVVFFIGQLTPIGYFLLRHEGPIDSLAQFEVAMIQIASRSLTVSLSAIMGVPAILIPIYFAVRHTRMSFADYLGLRWTGWKNFALGVVGMVVILGCWELAAQLTGREEKSASFMVDIMKTARGDGVVWLMIIAFCVAAPVSEELMARGFLYRGWSDSFLRVPGAIVLSSLLWTVLHLQYDWFALLNVFSLGVWFGYLRYRTHSLYLTMVLHGLNNLAATLQTMWLASGNG
ncbi:CPBP family intramembrane glutamic endopeptidase [Bradyrhizobium sp. STM 3809]|uniref:CPBP family intramembrane glutamic endopeptidase n=1 Tax=Bradyrhizobium sp. STM 3809 TaxID=551936 RepID=UPI000240A2B3|nr:CPBP family intramembrane glutamic endopeptidase [Bradyrhizobium sp. STM 3809]CCE02356.1 putative protease (CAAX family); membrane protein [Bradyrhizobium sp. STM 3809]